MFPSLCSLCCCNAKNWHMLRCPSCDYIDNMKPKETVTCASFLSSSLGSPQQSPNDHDDRLAGYMMIMIMITIRTMMILIMMVLMDADGICWTLMFKSNAILCAHARPAAPALVCAAKQRHQPSRCFACNAALWVFSGPCLLEACSQGYLGLCWKVL